MTTEEYLKKISASIQSAQTTLGMPVTQTTTQTTQPATQTTDPTRQEKITQLGEGLAGAQKQLETIKSGYQNVYGTDPLTTTEAPPELPSQFDYDAYFSSLIAEQEKTRLSLESAYQKQIDMLKSQQEAAQKRIDEYTAKTEATLEEVKEITQPWQADLEKSERERLKVEENFFANQQSIGELEQLLNKAMEDIQAAESVTGLGAIRYPRIAKVKEDYQARVGVIEAVMAARNNQISVANNLIDRSIAAVVSDKNAQLSYYNAVMNFYDNLRDEEGNQLIRLEAQERNYINAQIGLIENDLLRAQESADYIKGLMMDPSMAHMMEAAGVKVTDTPAQIQAKFAQYQYSEELREFANTASAQGYTRITAQQAATLGEGQVITQTDSRGNVSHWKVPMEQETWATGTPTSYKEWQLAGSPGTFEDWLGGGTPTFYGEDGEELDKWGAVRSLVIANPNASEAELVNAAREEIIDPKTGKPLFTEGEIKRIIAEEQAKMPPKSLPTPDKIKKTIVELIRGLDPELTLITRSEAEEQAISKLKEQTGLTSIPDDYKKAIEDALIELYGPTRWQTIKGWFQ